MCNPMVLDRYCTLYKSIQFSVLGNMMGWKGFDVLLYASVCMPTCVRLCMNNFVWMSPNTSMWSHMLAHSIYRWLWPRTWQLCIFHRVESPALQCLYIAASSSCDSGSGSDQRRRIKATSPAPFLSGLSLCSETLSSHYFTTVIYFCVFLLSCSRLWNSSRNCSWTISFKTSSGTDTRNIIYVLNKSNKYKICAKKQG